jgi:hypothetical protein
MPTILNLAAVPPSTPGLLAGACAVAAATDGLYAVRLEGGTPQLELLAQPMQGLAAVALVGDRLLVGGSPYGVASILTAHAESALPAAGAPLPGTEAPATQGSWQGGWMDHVQAPIIALAAAPGADESGLLLAASAGEGILRSTNRGMGWDLCTCGLDDFTVLSLAWAPPPPAGRWPARAIVFAGSESGIFRSPASGLAWQRSGGVTLPVQSLAVSPTFHDDGMVLAAVDTSEGPADEGSPGTAPGTGPGTAPTAPLSALWLSTDGGRTFAGVATAPAGVNALFATVSGWVAATPDGLAFSADGRSWRQSSAAPDTLALLALDDGLLAGGDGLRFVPWSDTGLAATSQRAG